MSSACWNSSPRLELTETSALAAALLHLNTDNTGKVLHAVLGCLHSLAFCQPGLRRHCRPCTECGAPEHCWKHHAYAAFLANYHINKNGELVPGGPRKKEDMKPGPKAKSPAKRKTAGTRNDKNKEKKLPTPERLTEMARTPCPKGKDYPRLADGSRWYDHSADKVRNGGSLNLSTTFPFLVLPKNGSKV